MWVALSIHTFSIIVMRGSIERDGEGEAAFHVITILLSAPRNFLHKEFEGVISHFLGNGSMVVVHTAIGFKQLQLLSTGSTIF